MQKVKYQNLMTFLIAVLFLVSMLTLSGCGSSKAALTESANSWTLVNPEGVIQPQVIKLNPHPSTLEGKTVALRWNGKENGQNLLEEVAVQLQQKVKNVRIIRIHEIIPESIGYSPAAITPDRLEKIVALKPDIIISAQAD